MVRKILKEVLIFMALVAGFLFWVFVFWTGLYVHGVIIMIRKILKEVLMFVVLLAEFLFWVWIAVFTCIGIIAIFFS